MIAFLGTGLLGAGFVQALLRRGETVHVWNRSFAKAEALTGAGARAFADPAEAVRGAERVHLTLSDDAAVDEVLERARPGFGAEVLLVDHTTTAPTGTRARVARWDERGLRFVHAPVFMGPQNTLESTGVMLVSGERARVAAVQPYLERMTGKLVDLGERPDQAACMKLLGNLFLMFLTSGVAEVFNLGRALAVDPLQAAELFSYFNPGATVGGRAERMLAGEFSQPSWELAMARKDARLMLEEAAQAERSLAVLPAIAALMDRYIARGHGQDDWTVIARDALERGGAP
ncbi:NAD(P)-dependent oxidoreductase [Nannocystis sp. SCPEA4]|uniref:NAD(P)-dependent oxidoreductase n=1 Tax=Nannocystis sp. SCPEA4 TaxID=2996787 RepID=UPI00226E1A52|nr:NAD(P)-dependent oxidoreductase [Nannocystis sp. SCPEA4]MCY1054018.1 NAD(P)-dependent oxidoreductase [Nannocystis sp. SCPEA4]